MIDYQTSMGFIPFYENFKENFVVAVISFDEFII